MLVFLDESYEDAPDGGLIHAYAGFGIHEHHYRHFASGVLQCKMKYFRTADGLTPDQIKAARATHIIVSGSPEARRKPLGAGEAALKGRLLGG